MFRVFAAKHSQEMSSNVAPSFASTSFLPNKALPLKVPGASVGTGLERQPLATKRWSLQRRRSSERGQEKQEPAKDIREDVPCRRPDHGSLSDPDTWSRCLNISW